MMSLQMNKVLLLLFLSCFVYVPQAQAESIREDIYKKLNNLCSDGLKPRGEAFNFQLIYPVGFSGRTVPHDQLILDVGSGCAYYLNDDAPTFPKIDICDAKSDWHCLSVSNGVIGKLRFPRKRNDMKSWATDGVEYTFKKVESTAGRSEEISYVLTAKDLNTDRSGGQVVFSYYLDKVMQLKSIAKSSTHLLKDGKEIVVIDYVLIANGRKLRITDY